MPGNNTFLATSSPLAEPNHSGTALPYGSLYPTTVAMNTLGFVEGYEQGDQSVLAKMQAGYPRFFMPQTVQQLNRQLNQGCSDTIHRAFPSQQSAMECREFIQKKLSVRINGTIEPIGCGLWQLSVRETEGVANAIKLFMQHSGHIVSIRHAMQWMKNPEQDNIMDVDSLEALKKDLADLAGTSSENVFLLPTGMAAIFDLYQVISSLHNDRTTSVQLGFSYLDTLKIQDHYGSNGAENFHLLTDYQDTTALRAALTSGKIRAVFCEVPNNPLLQTLDLASVVKLAHEYDVPVVVDDTVGTSYNVDVLSVGADAVTTSLTKFYSGYGDVMGGAVIVNPRSPFAETLLEGMRVRRCEQELFGADVTQLKSNGSDFRSRMGVVNANGLAVAEFLKSHREVDRVYYTNEDQNYAGLKRSHGGHGGLLSFLIKNSTRARVETVYDNAGVFKCPGLGFNATTLCLYTLLAHFHELDKVAALGIAPYLLRLSVGTENPDVIIQRLEAGFKALAR